MRIRMVLSVLAFSCAVIASPASAGSLKLTFVSPDSYTDGGGKTAFALPTAADAQKAIGDHLNALAQSKLPPSAVLKIEVLDIDLAGRPNLGGQNRDVRIFDDISPPRIKMHFALEDGGRVVSSGEDNVSDPSYLNSVGKQNYGPLDRERAMLSKWFAGRFLKGN